MTTAPSRADNWLRRGSSEATPNGMILVRHVHGPTATEARCRSGSLTVRFLRELNGGQHAVVIGIGHSYSASHAHRGRP
jgi:hypothetical protein